MAITRSSSGSDEVVYIQKKLKPETFAKLNTLVNRKKVGDHPITAQTKIHCYVPVCIGYDGNTMSPEELTEIIRAIQEKGYDFTILAAPRPKLGNDDEDPYVKWQKDNLTLLNEVGKKVILESVFRQSNAWLNAQIKYDQFMLKDPTLLDKLLKVDVDGYLKRHQDAAPEEVKKHLKDCAIDILAWMVEETSDNSDLLQLNTFIYHHKLTNVMDNALKNAKSIGYVPGTLTHLEPKFAETYQHDHENLAESATSLTAYAKTLKDSNSGLTQKQKDGLESITSAFCTGKTDPLYAAKILALLLKEIEEDQRQSHTVSVTTSSSNSTLSVPPRRRQPSPGRNGMFSRSSAAAAAAAAAAISTPLPPSDNDTQYAANDSVSSNKR